MKNLSKTMFGALALVGLSTSIAFAGNTIDKESVQENNIMSNKIVFDNDGVTGSSNYHINSNGAVLMYDTGDGINYKVSEGNLEEILAQIENGTFDMTQPFAIFESDLTKDNTKDLFLLVWDGSELLQHRISDLGEQSIMHLIVNEDGTVLTDLGEQSIMQLIVSEDGTVLTDKEGLYRSDDDSQLVIIGNN